MLSRDTEASLHAAADLSRELSGLLKDEGTRRIARDLVLRNEEARDLLEDFLVLDRNAEPVVGNVRTAAILDEALARMKDRPDIARVEVRRKFDEGAPAVRGDEAQLTDLCTTLIRSTCRLLGGEGILEISVRDLRNDPSRDPRRPIVVEFFGHPLPAGAPEAQKIDGEQEVSGMGLGIAVARQIAETNGAEVEAEMQRSGGAFLRLRLPV
jgi:signal transduction histidine kinase